MTHEKCNWALKICDTIRPSPQPLVNEIRAV